MAKDRDQETVCIALEKDGWTITADPYILRGSDITLLADLAAERLIVAQKEKEEIVIEIKSFSNQSVIHTFHTVVGQYRNYNRLLRVQDKKRML